MEAAPSQHEVTHLLRARSAGDRNALAPLVYREPHRAARRYMARQEPDHTLQTTALVNKVYPRLIAFGQLSWEERAHVLAVCAPLMHRIRTDWARRQGSLSRGEGVRHIPFEGALVLLPERMEGPVTNRPQKGQVVDGDLIVA